MEEQRVGIPDPARYLSVREAARTPRISGKWVCVEKGRLPAMRVGGNTAALLEDRERLWPDGHPLPSGASPPHALLPPYGPHLCTEQAREAQAAGQTPGREWTGRYLLTGFVARGSAESAITAGQVGSKRVGRNLTLRDRPGVEQDLTAFPRTGERTLPERADSNFQQTPYMALQARSVLCMPDALRCSDPAIC